MERMEVDHCAGAAGGTLRRSNSAPMITSVGERMAASSQVSVRYRRVSVNCSSQEDNMDAALGGTLQRTQVCKHFLCASPSSDGAVPVSSSWHEHPREWVRSDDSTVTPNSSPSPSRRFRPAGRACVRWPSLTPLKRKGGAESDGPPKKLFVTGVLDPAAHAASASLADSAPSPQSSPLAPHLHPAH
ncbi:PABIR family member 2 isoform X2 [Nerophis ophidion]|uniref:PABIR family member 2 isoform X2 n=1 Tax=Nerophis ophidion TaxID=159077 RepID=UPI002ADF819A|nr:PABIR family member 2 isoform X2 [Nerophis ophidion]